MMEVSEVLDYEDFILAMAERYVELGGFERVNEDGLLYCSAVLNNFMIDSQIDYAHPSYAWDRDGARELANEDYSYWGD